MRRYSHGNAGGWDTTPGLAKVRRRSALGDLRAQERETRVGQRTIKHTPVTAKGRLGDETLKTKIAMMAAAACSVEAIARGLLMSQERVRGILSQVETKGLAEDFRKIVKAHALSESIDIAVKGMAWVQETIDNREPKAFDMVARGLSNMERVWSSASGENRPQGVQVAVINQPTESQAGEIAALVDLLVGHTP